MAVFTIIDVLRQVDRFRQIRLLLSEEETTQFLNSDLSLAQGIALLGQAHEDGPKEKPVAKKPAAKKAKAT